MTSIFLTNENPSYPFTQNPAVNVPFEVSGSLAKGPFPELIPVVNPLVCTVEIFLL